MTEIKIKNAGVTKKNLSMTLIIIPFILLFSMIMIFNVLTHNFGSTIGWLGGMTIYWLFWCLAFPIFLLGWYDVKELFIKSKWELTKPIWLGLFLLIFPPLMAILFGPFRGRVGKATPLILLLSLIFAIINATLEELLWRGVYPKIFPKNIYLGYLYPSLGFALWHVAPLISNFSIQGAIAMVGGGLIIGLCWGYLAWRTGSIKWTIVSHIILDFSGLIAVTLI